MRLFNAAEGKFNITKSANKSTVMPARLSTRSIANASAPCFKQKYHKNCVAPDLNISNVTIRNQFGIIVLVLDHMLTRILLLGGCWTIMIPD